MGVATTRQLEDPDRTFPFFRRPADIPTFSFLLHQPHVLAAIDDVHASALRGAFSAATPTEQLRHTPRRERPALPTATYSPSSSPIPARDDQTLTRFCSSSVIDQAARVTCTAARLPRHPPWTPLHATRSDPAAFEANSSSTRAVATAAPPASTHRRRRRRRLPRCPTLLLSLCCCSRGPVSRTRRPCGTHTPTCRRGDPDAAARATLHQEPVLWDPHNRDQATHTGKAAKESGAGHPLPPFSEVGLQRGPPSHRSQPEDPRPGRTVGVKII